MTGHNMTDTNYTTFTSLIEQRIRAQVEAEAAPAIAEFEQAIEAAIKKLKVYPAMAPTRTLVEYVRTNHIDNLVDRRITALTEQLVPEFTNSQMRVNLDQTRIVSKSWGGAGFDALVGQPAAHADEQIVLQATNSTVVCAGDGSVPAGATLIIECDQALTNEQKEATEARALSKLPPGCQVLVLDRGLKASVSVTVPVPTK